MGDSVELLWKGKKRPEELSCSSFCLRERYGCEKDGWANRIYLGDNLKVMGNLLRDFRGLVDLVYIDPPYNSNACYKKKITLKGSHKDKHCVKVQYKDNWEPHEYLQFMYERLFPMKDLLSEKGTLYLHCDHRSVSYLKCLLDEVFGEEYFLNMIAWRRQIPRGMKAHARYYSYSADYLLIYSKGGSPLWKRQVVKNLLTVPEAKRKYQRDDKGFFRTSDPGTYSFKRLLKLHEEGRLYASKGGEILIDRRNKTVRASKGGSVAVKYYREMKDGCVAEEKVVDNIWDDIPGMGIVSGEFLGYPTQKPEKLLERVIRASTDEGDLVFDCFMGSGTTQAVAVKLGRRFIGADNSLGSIDTTVKRLISLGEAGGLKRPTFHLYTEEPCPFLRLENTGVTDQVMIFTGEENTITLSLENDHLTLKGFRSREAWEKIGGIETDDWKAFVDSFMVDWNYDGNVMKPALIDMPCGEKMIEGCYPLPFSRSMVKIRITDVLSNVFVALLPAGC